MKAIAINILSVAALTLMASLSHAGVNLHIQQVGDDVVVTGGGYLDTNQWTKSQFSPQPGDAFLSNESAVVGALSSTDTYEANLGENGTNFTGPSPITSGGAPKPDSGTGAVFGIISGEDSGGLVVPENYTSASRLGFSSATFENTAISDLNLTADKFHWEWDNSNGTKQDFFNIVVNKGPSASNITYNLTTDPGLLNGFGYSGTITTDGTLGNFDLKDALPIIDWNISMITPSGVDGVSERTLTPLNSFLAQDFRGLAEISFTESEISLLDFDIGDQRGVLEFVNTEDGLEERLSFTKRYEESSFNRILAGDEGEEFEFVRSLESAGGDFVIATSVVPEPSTVAMLVAGCSLLLAMSRRRS